MDDQLKTLLNAVRALVSVMEKLGDKFEVPDLQRELGTLDGATIPIRALPAYKNLDATGRFAPYAANLDSLPDKEARVQYCWLMLTWGIVQQPEESEVLAHVMLWLPLLVRVLKQSDFPAVPLPAKFKGFTLPEIPE